MHLEVGEHGRQPRADRPDRVVPEDQVTGEEQPGERGEPPAAPRHRAMAPPLAEGDDRQERQPEQRPVHRAGLGADLRPAVEDARERDAHRPAQRREMRPGRDPAQRPGKVAVAGRYRWVVRAGHPAWLSSRRPGAPTKRRPSSAYCAWSGGDGASSMRSVPDAVFGKAMTSRMFVW